MTWEPSKTDVIEVAEALINTCVEYDSNHSDYCRYCLNDENPRGILKHKLTCVVLKAKDILT